jgi:hypothetical protein
MGIEIVRDGLRFSPRLPDALRRLDLRIRYRGHTLDLTLTRGAFTVRAREGAAAPIRVQVKDDTRTIATGSASSCLTQAHAGHGKTGGHRRYLHITERHSARGAAAYASHPRTSRAVPGVARRHSPGKRAMKRVPASLLDWTAISPPCARTI